MEIRDAGDTRSDCEGHPPGHPEAPFGRGEDPLRLLKHGTGNCPVARVPADEIEAAVIDQIRGILRAPEMVISTWRAAQAECNDLAEEEVREALASLYPLWAELFPTEQPRVVQLLIERVDIGTDGSRLRFPDKGLAQMVTEVGMTAGKGRKAA